MWQHQNIALSLAVVLVAVRNPLNIGAAARAMANFGFDDLRAVRPYDPAFREAVSAVGGSEVLSRAKVFDSVADAVGDCSLVVGTTAGTRRVSQCPLERLESAADSIRAHSGRVALLFGSEKFGLSNDDISYCHLLARIPTAPEAPSMNLGQAVAVCLYELARNASEPPRRSRFCALEGADAEQLTSMLLDVLRASGYTNRMTSVSTQQKVRRWIRRLRIGRADAAMLMGILRQILWNIDRTR